MGETTRKLAAIMFSDIAGYTSLMQEDEQKAKAFRDKYKRTLKAEFSNARGKILQYYGDGSLCMFDSAIEAVKLAIKLQKQMTAEPKVDLRIGIHLGDIMYDGDGAYGDGVNVASRIESLSIPGAVLISEKVYDEIRNQPPLNAVSLGFFELKNVNKPLEVFALSSDGLTLPKRDEIKGKQKQNPGSIAVLPFINMSPDRHPVC